MSKLGCIFIKRHMRNLNSHLSIRVFILLVALGLIVSCRKATTSNWDVDLVLPITSSTLNISNYVGDTVLKPDQNGLFHVKINRELASFKVDSLLRLPDTTFVQSFTIPAIGDPTVNPGQIIPITAANESVFDLPNGIQLKTVEIRKSILHIKFSNTITQPLDVSITLPGVIKNGNALTINETIPTGTNSLVRDYNLAGYVLNLTGISGKGYNALVENVGIKVNPNAGSAVVKYGQGLSMELGYTDIIPQFVEGYFGQQKINLPSDTTKLDIYKGFSADNFMLSDASLKFSVVNDIGADFSGSISNLISFNSATRKKVVMNNTQLNRCFLNQASRINTNIASSTLAVAFNTLNSNVTAFISNMPDKISYTGSVTINPLGDEVKRYDQFAFYNTGIHVFADIDIPVRFNATAFNLTTDTKVDFSNVKQLDNFNAGAFVIHVTNTFPFAAQAQAYLLNQNKQVIDSLFSPGANTIACGKLNSQNIVVEAAESTIRMTFDKNKLANLKQTKYIQVKSRVLFPPNPPDIQILDNYSVKVNVVAEINYNAKIGR